MNPHHPDLCSRLREVNLNMKSVSPTNILPHQNLIPLQPSSLNFLFWLSPKSFIYFPVDLPSIFPHNFAHLFKSIILYPVSPQNSALKVDNRNKASCWLDLEFRPLATHANPLTPQKMYMVLWAENEVCHEIKFAKFAPLAFPPP